MTIKTMLFGFAALGVGGAALTGGALGGGHDAERAVARPPADVYAAIATLSPEGVQERPAGEDGPAMSFEVRKEEGKAVHWVLKIEGRVAGTLDLAVAPDKDGTASLLSADIDLDRAALRKVMPGGGELLAMPDALLNVAARGALDDIAANIEAGIPLEGIGPDDLAAWQGQSGGGEGSGGEALTASGPLGSTEPMVDPNESARNYLNGGN